MRPLRRGRSQLGKFWNMNIFPGKAALSSVPPGEAGSWTPHTPRTQSKRTSFTDQPCHIHVLPTESHLHKTETVTRVVSVSTMSSLCQACSRHSVDISWVNEWMNKAVERGWEWTPSPFCKKTQKTHRNSGPRCWKPSLKWVKSPHLNSKHSK